MSPTIQIEFVSDVSCSWCAVGLHNLQKALDSLERVRHSGEPVGINFRLNDSSRIYNTFDAHRLLYWAALEGHHKALKHALFTSHFTQGGDPSETTSN